MNARALLLITAPLWAAASSSCGPPPPGTYGAVAPRRGLAGAILREDRVTVTRGTIVHAIGVSRRFIYAATLDAIIVYDRDRRAWLPPFTRDGGFDPSLVRRIAIDPADESAWLITQLGAWTLQPLTGFVARAPGGALPARLRLSSLQEVYREFPSVESFGRLLTRDDALQSFSVIAGARAPDRTEVWLGTNGGGLFQVDPLFNQATPQPFGLAAGGAGALARAADGIWMAPASRGVEPRLAVTFATNDLQQWRWLDDEARRSFGGARATSLDVRAGTIWMGTTRGLFRLPMNGAGVRAVTPLAGLPSDVVLSILARGDGVWVGTERGLAFLDTDSTEGRGSLVTLGGLPGVAVRALLSTGDTLWVGTDDGLVLRAPHAGDQFVRPAAAAAQPRLRQPVRALAGADSLVFVALSDAVLTFSLRDGAWREPWPAVAWRSVGAIETLAADARTVWAGGAFGVLAVDRATGGSRILRVGSDLPDVVTSILLDGPYAWIGTLGGVVRVRRGADGLFP
ncbi:MAG TPA: hypothetical protein VGJ96_02225 [Gemmatimonadaceae bacterium]